MTNKAGDIVNIFDQGTAQVLMRRLIKKLGFEEREGADFRNIVMITTDDDLEFWLAERVEGVEVLHV